ncbi:hypothetical protein NO1_1278 [Candidatus Termititenax aidoneus]|uniref:Uncharacterized protein n=1 Tax=Termititenax aidoneus TaxID=2218524 RepID=A0A388TB85_TERA1|nr:hypothetical protein NO1_1278 [Candidatus Termititenax aidoneus]
MTQKFIEIKDNGLIKHLRSLANFDGINNIVKDVALKTNAKLKANTPTHYFRNSRTKTGNTKRGWRAPIQLGIGKYLIRNSITTSNNRWLIVNLLDEGTAIMAARPFIKNILSDARKELKERVHVWIQSKL